MEISTPRRLSHWAVFGFSAFLFVRTACVEPFGVPTGSMAATLYGNHREGFCPRCGMRLSVGVSPDGDPDERFRRLPCPNCGHVVDLSAAPEVPGDRLLVDKTAFLARPPRRFEVAVFHCPTDDNKPYVKRVVGLPGERIQIRAGDVLADGRLLRKSHAQALEMAVTVFDYRFAPAEGWASRFAVESLSTARQDPPAVVTTQGLRLDDRHGTGLGVSYCQRDLTTQAEGRVTDAVSYNGATGRGRFAETRGPEPVRDFLAEFTLTVAADTKPGRFACRLSDGRESVRADFAVAAPGGVVVSADRGPERVARPGLTLAPGQTVRVAFAFVDCRATLSVDGVEVIPPLDLPLQEHRSRGVARPVQFGVRDASVVVGELRIARDVHYLAPRPDAEWHLRSADYFVLGDNAHDSHDSRAWVDGRGVPAPGVPLGAFLGKPFLVHQPLRLSRLPGGAVVPSPDWDRLRFLR